MSVAASAPSTGNEAVSTETAAPNDGGVIVIGAGSPTPLGPKIVFADEGACRLTGFDRASLVGSPLGLIYDRNHLSDLIRKLPAIAQRPNYCWMDRDLIRKSDLRTRMRWTIRPTRHRGRPSEQFFTLTFSDLPGAAETNGGSGESSLEESSRRPENRGQEEIRVPSEANAVTVRPSRIAEAEAGPASPGELTLSEEELKEARELSVSWSASAVAHDFKNVLQKIMMNLDMATLAADEEAASHAKVKQLIGKAQVSLGEAETLARQLFDFARGVPPETRVFDTREVLTRVVRFASVGGNAQIRARIHPELRPVEGDPDQIFRVIQNLLVNANQAMPGGGTIDVSATNRDYEEPGNEFGLAAGAYTVISIRDRGIGISPQALPHIFAPGFSTKSGGYGFGLASCKAAVEAHGGEIRVASRENVGTQFLIFLPSSDQPLPETGDGESSPGDGFGNARSAGDGQAGDRSSGGRNSGNRDSGNRDSDPCRRRSADLNLVVPPARILIVEDEPGVAESTRMALHHFGHTTASAETGEEALQIFRSHLDSEEPIDLVLLDMTLKGGLDGVEVFAEMKKMDDTVPVIATSGHFDEDSDLMAASTGFTGVLAKPFTMDALKLTVSTALTS